MNTIQNTNFQMIDEENKITGRSRIDSANGREMIKNISPEKSRVKIDNLEHDIILSPENDANQYAKSNFVGNPKNSIAPINYFQCKPTDCKADYERLRNLKGFAFFIYLFGSYFLSIMLIVFYFGDSQFKIFSYLGAFQGITDNLYSDPILDLKLQTVCDSGYTYKSLGTWPGTGPICACSGNSSSGTCADTQINCININPISSKPYRYWRSSSKNWCIKRAVRGLDYIKASICPTGYSQCSPGNCFLNGVGCPLSNLTVSYSNETEFNSISIGSRYLNLYFTNGSSPLIDISVNYGGLPCIESDRIGLEKRYSYYSFDDSGCGRYGADRNSYTIDKDIEYSQMSVNSLLLFTSSLPRFSDASTKTDLSLNIKRQITPALITKCLFIDKTYFQNIIDASQSIENLLSVNTLLAISIHTTVFVVFLAIFFESNEDCRSLAFNNQGLCGIVCLLFIGPCKIEPAESKMEIFSQKIFQVFYLFFYGLESIIWVMSFIITNLQFTKMYEAGNYYESLVKLKCYSLNQANIVLSDYETSVSGSISRLQGIFAAMLTISLTSYSILLSATLKQAKLKKTGVAPSK